MPGIWPASQKLSLAPNITLQLSSIPMVAFLSLADSRISHPSCDWTFGLGKFA
jgi:hypothetical protein